ncbi:hypothetical protein E8E12_007114 [Didymella heteroderae]|uniref:Sequence-specific DNA binding RNA polymerase II transcription factor n=1 Tax=Didymella heteroderae TaxID=1769908 RepID=A0A9P4WP96_9PLEO|nr:hypothetical protein E8E12_007114 [Didymella heteroderae]
MEDSSPKPDSSWQSVGSEDPIDAHPVCDSNPRSVPGNLFRMEDMALLHHWITVAGHSILETYDLGHYWHSVIPSIGFEHQYVIHSILSLSALHIAHTRPPNREGLLHISSEHRSKALDGFTEDLQHVSIANSTALFANTTLTFFYAFASFSRSFEDEGSDSNARISQVLGKEWISLVRGTAAVLELVYIHVREGPLRSFLELRKFTELDLTEYIHGSDLGARLQDFKRIWSTDEHAEVYNETLDLLLRCNAWMEQFDLMTDEAQSAFGYNRVCSGPFIWLICTPEKYIVLHQQRQPPALIIFAYYGVLLHRLDNYWWAEGCGRSIVNAADACLGPYWSGLLFWPKQIVGSA